MVKKLLCHMSQFQMSLTIIMDDGDEYFNFFMSKNLPNVMCQNLIDGWQLMTSTWHHGCSYNWIE
jgi:hypothetical protein